VRHGGPRGGRAGSGARVDAGDRADAADPTDATPVARSPGPARSGNRPDREPGSVDEPDVRRGSPPRGGGEGEGTSPPELAALLSEIAPRIVVEARGVVWADGRGLDATALAGALLDRLRDLGVTDARAGVASVPVVAECAVRASAQPPPRTPTGGLGDVGDMGVRHGRRRGGVPFRVKERTGFGNRVDTTADRRSPTAGGSRGKGGSAPQDASSLRVISRGDERSFLATLPLSILGPDDRTLELLRGVGVETLGELAALDAESVEVRFGPGGTALWRLARADDRRRLFRPIPPERLSASIDFVDYVLTDPARLVFTANALLGTVTERLQARGEHARRMRLVLPLANGETWHRSIRPARPTADREAWLRLIRALLERITVPDAVVGMSLEVEATEPAGVQQGDLFDRGFATAGAVEAAVARLMESRGPVFVEPDADRHPLLERRTTWHPAHHSAATLPATTPTPTGGRGDRGTGSRREPAPSGKGTSNPEHCPPRERTAVGDRRSAVGLTLQLLPEPRRVTVETVRRRDHEAPTRVRDRSWRQLVVAAGPDRISGGQWEGAYAREYFRCVTDEGVLLWIYRDARDEAWYLHGWWD